MNPDSFKKKKKKRKQKSRAIEWPALQRDEDAERIFQWERGHHWSAFEIPPNKKIYSHLLLKRMASYFFWDKGISIMATYDSNKSMCKSIFIYKSGLVYHLRWKRKGFSVYSSITTIAVKCICIKGIEHIIYMERWNLGHF